MIYYNSRSTLFVILIACAILFVAASFLRSRFDPYSAAEEQGMLDEDTFEFIHTAGLDQPLFQHVLSELAAKVQIICVSQGIILQGNYIAAMIVIFLFFYLMHLWSKLEATVFGEADGEDFPERAIVFVIHYFVTYICMYIISLLSYGLSLFTEKLLASSMRSNSEFFMILSIIITIALLIMLINMFKLLLPIMLEWTCYCLLLLLVFAAINFIVPLETLFTVETGSLFKRPLVLLCILALFIFDRIWSEVIKPNFYADV